MADSSSLMAELQHLKPSPESKKAPYKLVVDEATIDDNSFVSMHPSSMEKLKLERGNTILITGNKQRDTVCIVIGDEECEEPKIRMNEVVRSNIRVSLEEVVSIQLCDYTRYGKRVHVLPLADTVQGLTKNLYEALVKDYFFEAYRPVRKGDQFVVRGKGFASVEFKVVETDPAEYCTVSPDTEIVSEGRPIKRQDEQKFNGLKKKLKKLAWKEQMVQIREAVALPFKYPWLLGFIACSFVALFVSHVDDACSFVALFVSHVESKRRCTLVCME